MINVSKRMDVAETYYFAAKLSEIHNMRVKGLDVINLGIGSPDLDPPKGVTEALVQALSDKDAHQYQAYKGIPELTKAFADWYQNHFGVMIDAATQVLPLIGSKEGVLHVSMTFISDGDEVLVPNPGYPTYSMAARLSGGVVRYFDLDPDLNFLPNLDKLEQTDLEKVKIMWINYPNMPTGGVADLSFFKKLVLFAQKHNILICHDNPYTFILNPNPVNIFQVSGAISHVLELTSLSKNYNMSGWRVGAMVGNENAIKQVMRFKSNMDSGMFKPVQKAAVAALGMDKSWFDALNSIYEKRKRYAINILESLGCNINANGAGMFVWGKIPDHIQNAEIYSNWLLHHAHVFITPGHIFGSNGERYLRISLCSDLELLQCAHDRILHQLQTNFSSLKMSLV